LQHLKSNSNWFKQCCPCKKKNVYIKLAEAVSMRCEEKLRGRSEYPITKSM
jgi:hypothetical protein